MRNKLDELKLRIGTLLKVAPMFDSVGTLTKGRAQETRGDSPSGAMLSFCVSLDPCREDGSMLACDVSNPSCGHSLDLIESLEHLQGQIEKFERWAGSLARLGLPLGEVRLDKLGDGCTIIRSTSLNGHTLKLVLTIDDLIYVSIDFTGPDGQELWIDAEDEIWRIEAEDWTDNNPLEELMGDKTSEPGSAVYSRAGVLEALVERMQHPVKGRRTKTKTKTRRRKTRRYAVD